VICIKWIPLFLLDLLPGLISSVLIIPTIIIIIIIIITIMTCSNYYLRLSVSFTCIHSHAHTCHICDTVTGEALSFKHGAVLMPWLNAMPLLWCVYVCVGANVIIVLIITIIIIIIVIILINNNNNNDNSK